MPNRNVALVNSIESKSDEYRMANSYSCLCYHIYVRIPNIAQYLVTMIQKQMVNLLHVSALFGHLQGIMQQRQIQ